MLQVPLQENVYLFSIIWAQNHFKYFKIIFISIQNDFYGENLIRFLSLQSGISIVQFDLKEIDIISILLSNYFPFDTRFLNLFIIFLLRTSVLLVIDLLVLFPSSYNLILVPNLQFFIHSFNWDFDCIERKHYPRIMTPLKN